MFRHWASGSSRLRTRWLPAAQARLSDARWPAWAALLAILMTLPSVRAGFYLDDLGQRLRVAGFEGLPAATPWNLFTFVSGTPEDRSLMLGRGFLPWYTSEELRIAFWRPLSSLSHYLDYRFFPEMPALMHLQNILWYGLLIWLLAGLYRRLIAPAWVAGVASLLYLMDDAHGITVGWICNRNAMMAACFGLLVIQSHVAWRSSGRGRYLALGLLWYTIGLLGAEATVAALAYVVAYAACLDRASWAERVRSLLPYGVLTVAWRLVYQGLGAGAYGGDGYLDPGREPLTFLQAFPGRAIQYLQAQLLWPPTSLLPASEHRAYEWLLGGSVLFLALVAWVCRPLLRTHASSRFWTLGMLLAVVPICAARPQDRNLFFVGFGAMALVAQLLHVLIEPGELPEWKSRSWRLPAVGLGAAWVFVHLVLAPLSLPVASRVLSRIRDTARVIRTEAALPAGIGDKTLILTAVPYPFASGMFAAPTEERPEVPRHSLALSIGSTPVTLQRTGPQTVVVRPEAGYLADDQSRGFRPDRHPFGLGDRIELPDATVTVSALNARGLPAEATFELRVPLEDPSLVWLTWTGLRYELFKVPEVGASVQLPAVDFKPVFAAQ